VKIQCEDSASTIVNCEAVRVYTLQLCVTVCDPINPVVNPIVAVYAQQYTIVEKCVKVWTCDNHVCRLLHVLYI
jgi:hypothetical protein